MWGTTPFNGQVTLGPLGQGQQPHQFVNGPRPALLYQGGQGSLVTPKTSLAHPQGFQQPQMAPPQAQPRPQPMAQPLQPQNQLQQRTSGTPNFQPPGAFIPPAVREQQRDPRLLPHGMVMQQGHPNQAYHSGDNIRDQLEKKVQALEHEIRQKDMIINNLSNELKKAGINTKWITQKLKVAPHSPHKTQLSEAKPIVAYEAVNPNDPIDLRLEEFYNSTNSAIQFQRINRGWYKFGKTLVELDVINHKLMAKTDDGWNRGKYGDIEKFIVTFEPLERESAGIPFDS